MEIIQVSHVLYYVNIILWTALILQHLVFMSVQYEEIPRCAIFAFSIFWTLPNLILQGFCTGSFCDIKDFLK